ESIEAGGVDEGDLYFVDDNLFGVIAEPERFPNPLCMGSDQFSSTPAPDVTATERSRFGPHLSGLTPRCAVVGSPSIPTPSLATCAGQRRRGNPPGRS